MDKYDLLRTGVPIHEIRTRPKKATSVHRIDLKEGARPLKLRPTTIPMSAPMLEIAKELLRDHLELGIIEEAPRECPWGAPVILLRKGGNRPGVKNQWRLVTDYRGLNKLTVDQTYTPPNIRDVIDDLKDCKYFSKSDCVGGFYQMELDKADREKTAFTIKTPQGNKQYMFTVASLGLQGCPSSYQLWMEDVLD